MKFIKNTFRTYKKDEEKTAMRFLLREWVIEVTIKCHFIKDNLSKKCVKNIELKYK